MKFVAIAIASAVLSVVVAAAVLRRLPADYFCSEEPKKPSLLANFIGWLLILIGIVLSIPGVPGQGLLTVLAGVILADFPRKLALERWLMRKPGVFAGANAIRRRFHQPPFQAPTTYAAAENH